MFDFLLYPVSVVLWFWHTAFAGVLGPASGLTWALAVVFLTFTVRALLVRPALGQLRSAQRMRELAPRVAELQEKHAGDRQRLGAELQQLYAANGVNPLGGFASVLLQLPVLLSLYWVLRGFTPDAAANHVFDRAGVESFLNADLFGATLGNWISQPAAELAAFGTDHTHMLAVGVPLMLLAGLATFLTMRSALRRSAPGAPQLAAVSRAMTFLAPLGLLLSGLFFPVPLAVLLYFLATNAWTLVQQHLLTRIVDREAAGNEGRPRPGTT